MKRAAVVGLVLCIACSAFAVLALAQGTGTGPFAFKDFSATMVTSAAKGKTMSMKIYRSDDKLRTDMPGGSTHTLLLLGENKFYMVMPQMCMEMPQQKKPDPFGVTGTVERKQVGTDTVDGHPTKIEDITVTPSNGGAPVTMKAWEATDLKDFPVRVEMATAHGPVRIEYKDVDLSAPDASLFDKPDNCRVMPSFPGKPQL